MDTLLRFVDLKVSKERVAGSSHGYAGFEQPKRSAVGGYHEVLLLLILL